VVIFRHMKMLLIALQFLTILPVRVRGDVSERDMARSAAAFPAVGALQGAVLVGAAIVFGKVFPASLSLALVLLVLVITNGGFHLDGLADTFDALAARGGRERKLSAMKDSSTGAIGVTAIVFSLAIKYLALLGIAEAGRFPFYFSLLLMPMLSKWVMLAGMFHGKPAREDGLGRVFIEGVGAREFAAGATAAGLFAALPVVLLSAHARWYPFAAASLIIIYAGARAWFWFLKRGLGGLTGDTLGAAGELSENFFLLMVLAWSGIYI
jgi:adenosylcobinamide-GDP ribazoletransferase